MEFLDSLSPTFTDFVIFQSVQILEINNLLYLYILFYFLLQLNCDHTETREADLIKHIDKDHLEIENEPPNKTHANKTHSTSEDRPCRNGDTCRFLKDNRCMFFHDVAAQPSQNQWQSVHSRQRRPRSGSRAVVRGGAVPPQGVHVWRQV
jgi:hypothetical protein